MDEHAMDKPRVKPPRDRREPASVQDDDESLVRRDGYAGPEGQVASELDIEVDGAEVTGITQAGDGHKGRKPVGGGG